MRGYIGRTKKGRDFHLIADSKPTDPEFLEALHKLVDLAYEKEINIDQDHKGTSKRNNKPGLGDRKNRNRKGSHPGRKTKGSR